MIELKIIIMAANRVGLRQSDLNDTIIKIIEEALNKYQYWNDVDKEIKIKLAIDNTK